MPEDELRSIAGTVNSGPAQFEFVRYEVKDQQDPVELAVAKIMTEMHREEIAVVRRMAEMNLLHEQSVLVIDGSLRFKRREFDVAQFRNVIGVCKTFKPTFAVGKGRRREHAGTLVLNLEFGERTSVFKATNEENVLGCWYLRLRRRETMSNPLQGAVKVERYAVTPEERDGGLDAEVVDNLSTFILAERNVTPYKVDSRWASHLYPIFQAETFLKTSFRSDAHFMALF
jgi:hypothetical protein